MIASHRTQILAGFIAIAEAVEHGATDGAFQQRLAHLGALCQAAAGQEPAGELRTALANVQLALETWARVWPRLGRRPEFRMAVAREARLWAKRFAAQL